VDANLKIVIDLMSILVNHHLETLFIISNIISLNCTVFYFGCAGTLAKACFVLWYDGNRRFHHHRH